ncbi:unnamed protein product [Rhizophagus irregularis]|nr:unnamed protein product [Rhizophagus irregularis]CAB5352612.1 unnamed protein product [Rhizophagus irregularis]
MSSHIMGLQIFSLMELVILLRYIYHFFMPKIPNKVTDQIPNKANNRSDLNPNNRSSSNDQIPNKTNNSSSLNDPNKANYYVTSLNDQIKIYGVAIKSLYRKRFDLELFYDIIIVIPYIH